MLTIITFATWNLLFTGILVALLLLNLVQWAIYRERIYGLYTLYLLPWLFYFGCRNEVFYNYLSGGFWYFVKAVAPMLAYLVYFDFANQLVRLRDRLPRLMWLFRVMQGVIGLYAVAMGLLCAEVVPWNEGLYNTLHTLIRVVMIVVAGVGVWQIGRLNGAVPRYVALGSLFILLGGLVSMALTPALGNLPEPASFLLAPLTYFALGIMAELICFTLILGYRQRRGAIRNALIEQKLVREQEQRQREHLEAQLLSEKLQQQMSAMQMMALQSQLNPHFLFNSLNSLIALIGEDPAKAEAFAEELSSVYRYVLRAGEQSLTDLNTELEFIHSYFHLLKTRHGNGVDLIINVDDRFRTYLLPSLTLQLLVENAVKHNVVMVEQPLRIAIETDQQGYLQVRNTLQKKPTRVMSNGVGLTNILAKYQMLKQPTPTVQEVDGQFVVTLPLIRAGGS